jgi:hypothetical protein
VVLPDGDIVSLPVARVFGRYVVVRENEQWPKGGAHVGAIVEIDGGYEAHGFSTMGASGTLRGSASSTEEALALFKRGEGLKKPLV